MRLMQRPRWQRFLRLPLTFWFFYRGAWVLAESRYARLRVAWTLTLETLKP